MIRVHRILLVWHACDPSRSACPSVPALIYPTNFVKPEQCPMDYSLFHSLPHPLYLSFAVVSLAGAENYAAPRAVADACAIDPDVAVPAIPSSCSSNEVICARSAAQLAARAAGQVCYFSVTLRRHPISSLCPLYAMTVFAPFFVGLHVHTSSICPSCRMCLFVLTATSCAIPRESSASSSRLPQE